MALDPLATWTKKLDALPRTGNIPQGCANFAGAVADLTNKVQAGANGKSGILTFNRSLFATKLQSLKPTGTNSWATIVANAWLSAMQASTITPGTVTDPSWTNSKKDTFTLPSASSTITNLSSAKTKLETALKAAPPAKNSEAVAKAFRDTTLSLSFKVIGKASGSPPPSIPKTFTAQ